MADFKTREKQTNSILISMYNPFPELPYKIFMINRKENDVEIQGNDL